jgi:hypothetical protein
VPAGKAVTVNNGGRLDVTGTITVGGSSPASSVRAGLAVRQDVLAAAAASGGSLTVANGGTLAITGTVTGATGGQIVLEANATVTGGTFYTAGETAGNAETGTTYNWAADAGGTGAAGWQEAFDVVTSTYPLGTNDSNINTIGNPTNLTTYTVKKSKADGTIYIKVGGTLTGTNDFTGTNGLWGAKSWASSTGQWADMAFDYGTALLQPNASSVMAIRSTSFAYYYYKEKSGTATNTALTAPILTTAPNIYVPNNLDASNIPVKWKMYNVNTFGSAANMGIILWSDAPVKVVTIEIAKYASFADGAAKTADIAKIVLNYSGVTINAPAGS